MPSLTDRAYAAGVVDGEGSISASPSYNHPTNIRIQVAIGMCDSEVPEWMAVVFGGKVRLEARRTKAGKPVFTWTLHCQKAADFLELVLPYLKVKRSRALNAITLARLMKHRTKAKTHVFTAEEVAERRALATKIKDENIAGNGRVIRHAFKAG